MRHVLDETVLRMGFSRRLSEHLVHSQKESHRYITIEAIHR